MKLLGLLDLFRTPTLIPAKTRSYSSEAYQALKNIEAQVLEISAGARRLSEAVARVNKSIEESRKP